MRKLGTFFVPFGASPALKIACRDTPWHGESGKASTGGHITVDFLAPTHPEEKKRVVTHHVYKTDAAY
jgi:hypothetical protein